MDWIEQNLDAYRVIAEILTDLRPLVRKRLESGFGREWFRDGIPEDIFERLIRNKEQEASIDWYENRYQEVISYAVFPDLFEIISANPDLFGPILKLAPSPSLVNTRFLELEVMRSKIGRAREVSEAEINFLTSFHLRFRRAIAELRESSPDGETDAAEATPAGDADVPTDGGKETERKAGAGSESDADTRSKAPSAAPTPAPDRPKRPPQRLASPSAESTSGPEPEAEPSAPSDEPPDAGASGDAGPPEDEKAPAREATSTILKRAMENGDSQTVLRELYREVTGIAEVIWTTDQVPASPAWDRVSTNSWYESNFSKLDLRPLSDFFELINQVRAKLKGGASKTEIQSFLNDSRFASILLALRDMFQKNDI